MNKKELKRFNNIKGTRNMYWDSELDNGFEKNKIEEAYNEFIDKINYCIKEEMHSSIRVADKELADAMKLKNEAMEIKYEAETKYADIDKQIEERAKQLSREWIKSFYDVDFKVGDKVYHIKPQYHSIKCPMCKNTEHIKVMYKGNEVEVKCPKCDKCNYFYTYEYKEDTISFIELGLRMTKDNKVIQVEYPNTPIDDVPKLFNAYENDLRRIALKECYVNREELALTEEEAKEKVEIQRNKERERLLKYYSQEEIDQIFKNEEN